mgnify:CR=1 FL=1
MKSRIRSFFDNIFYTPSPLPPGTFQTTLELNGTPYRLHLRIEAEGKGLLIINASTILHLNPTAAEIAYYLITKLPIEQITSTLMRRYQVTSEIAVQDVENFKIRIESLIQTPDLDPETFLDMERIERHSDKLVTPVRLDCALTYQSSEGTSSLYAPIDRIKRSLDTEEWKEILNKSWNAGIPHVIFTGGEPTLRPDLEELIRHSESLGQVTGLITDGLRLTESEYLHQLLYAGLDHMMIILQPDEDQSWESIRDVINEDIYLCVHLTINGHNKDRISSILLKLKNIGIRALSLSAISDEWITELSLAARNAAEIGLSLVHELPVPYSSINPVSVEMETNEASKKGAGRTWLYVEPDGDVLLGQGSEICIGNFLTDPWETISGNRKLEPSK